MSSPDSDDVKIEAFVEKAKEHAKKMNPVDVQVEARKNKSFDLMATVQGHPLILSSEVMLAAMLSSLSYKQSGLESIQKEVSDLTQMGMTPSHTFPWFELGLQAPSTGVGSPLLFMVHYKYMASQGKRFPAMYDVTLYFAFRGSQTSMDWTTNFDVRPSHSHARGEVLVHGGMQIFFNGFQNFIEKKIEEIEEIEKDGLTCAVKRVCFTGHSLGGGVAQLANFEFNADRNSTWPNLDEETRDQLDAFAITFAAPPIFFNLKESQLPEEVESHIRERTMNFFMEFDPVPRIAYPGYIRSVAISTKSHKVDQHFAPCRVISKAISNLALDKIESAVESEVNKKQDGMSIADAASQLSHMCVMYMFRYSKSQWECVVLSTPAECEKILATDYPFEHFSTCLATEDHSVLPHKALMEWREDKCCKYLATMDCDVAAKVKEDSDIMLNDCSLCAQTFCGSCFAKHHLGSQCKFHGKIQRCYVDKVRPEGCLALALQKDVDVVMKEISWFKASIAKECRGFFQGAMNIFYLMDMVGDITIHTGHHLGALGFLGSVTPGVSCIFVGGIAAIQSASLLYAGFMGTLEMKVMWKGLRRCWTKAFLSMAGTFAGAAVGALLGTIFGPVGIFLGGAIGAAVGGILGNIVGGAVSDKLESWWDGLTEDREDQIRKALVCEALMLLQMKGTAPSKMEGSAVRSKYRALAQIHHPDKNEMIRPFLCKSKEELTEKETKLLMEANNEFVLLHHNCEVLEAFIKDREAGLITAAELKAYDDMAAGMSEGWQKIDEQAKAQRDARRKELFKQYVTA